MTHLTMEALLSLREAGLEPGDATAREHLELRRLSGRSWTGCTSGWLGSRRCPRSVPPGTAGPQTAARLREERRARRRRIGGLIGLAAAASIALGVFVGARPRAGVARGAGDPARPWRAPRRWRAP